MAVKKVEDAEITVLEITKGRVDFCVLGTTPLICNRMSQKVKQELLMPKGRKNAAEKASQLKHNPLDEFRDSPYVLTDPKAPTLIAGLATWFKAALCTAALDMPGTRKAQIGRLTYVVGYMVPVFGLPKLMMSCTRSADMNKTPDVRTRAILPEWACQVSIEFVRPIMREQAVVNLLAASGITMGVGDWRPQKGSGNFGQFKLVSASDKDYVRIMKQGREQQIKAMAEALPFDDETSELLSWFTAESARRGFKVAA